MKAAALSLFAAVSPMAPAAELTIPARPYWTETRVKVVKGRRYTVKLVAMDQVKDCFIEIRDLEGWPPSIWRTIAETIAWSRRRPAEPWMSVFATVDKENPRRLRPGVATYEAPATGRLFCYFNDAPWAYSNNKGTVRLRLEPAAPPQRARR